MLCQSLRGADDQVVPALGNSSFSFAFDVYREIIRRLERGLVPQIECQTQGVEPRSQVGGGGGDFDGDVVHGDVTAETQGFSG
jgi:hypothetical protein